ncbi:Sec-independent protein translocase TatB [Timonella senegalensis]|uniref:Sec-independent protein translocase TatB n=1 Tax=Timonella senegalensis TaxID=1465825 RepID=UPI0028A9F637|nr:Sec-independent protein translocase TatB [Timonella senegalensis]
MAGINGGEFLVILVIAVIVIGPERLPKYAEQFAQFIKGAKKFVTEAKAKVDDELGPEVKDIDWQKLDPRQYDPRRIVKEALLDDTILDPEYEKKKAAKAAAAGLTAAGVSAATTGAVADTPGSGSAIPGHSTQAGAPAQWGPGFDTYTPLPAGQSAPFDTEST